MHGARFRDEKLCSCAGWRFNCSGAVITANTVKARTYSVMENGLRKRAYIRPPITAIIMALSFSYMSIFHVLTLRTPQLIATEPPKVTIR